MLDSQKLRSMIRAVLLEDRASFIAAAADADLEYYGHPNDPLFMWKPHVAIRKKARKLKDLWRQHADQASFDEVTLVHWIKHPLGQLAGIWGAPRNDEISVSMSPPTGPIADTSWGPIGLEVKGSVTFAANDMNMLMTGYMSKAKPNDLSKYPRGGRPKRPTQFGPGNWNSYVLQASELDFSQSDNEALLDHWSPVCWVVSDSFRYVFAPSRMSDKIEQEEMLDVIRASGLPIMDLNRQPVSFESLEDLL